MLLIPERWINYWPAETNSGHREVMLIRPNRSLSLPQEWLRGDTKTYKVRHSHPKWIVLSICLNISDGLSLGRAQVVILFLFGRLSQSQLRETRLAVGRLADLNPELQVRSNESSPTLCNCHVTSDAFSSETHCCKSAHF